MGPWGVSWARSGDAHMAGASEEAAINVSVANFIIRLDARRAARAASFRFSEFTVEHWAAHSEGNFLAGGESATILRFVDEPKQARKFLISGTVQGVGFRYFTQRAAAKIKVGGYVKNLRDGRVEVFAMGTGQQLRALHNELKRGPRFSSVTEVREESAPSDAKYDGVFVIGDSSE
jgi:acylphosphatase